MIRKRLKSWEVLATKITEHAEKLLRFLEQEKLSFLVQNDTIHGYDRSFYHCSLRNHFVGVSLESICFQLLKVQNPSILIYYRSLIHVDTLISSFLYAGTAYYDQNFVSDKLWTERHVSEISFYWRKLFLYQICVSNRRRRSLNSDWVANL